ncbi:ATP-binding cassette domain-containing protein [Actinomadura macra]|uniref:ATP-binding cassette domain-containing protein n=1 Tax=Actinomadura macra TaxID=46164 RepID=UPI000AB6C02F|nr:ATP-binding cassette domain-containing protein [Actinomadura macra]
MGGFHLVLLYEGTMPITFNRCTFGYRRRQPVLQDFSFEFPAGCSVLLGPNGAGKSTLLGLAASLLYASDGSVSYGRLDPAHRRERSSYRRKVGWMPQSIRAVPGFTVREQVSYSGWLKGLSRADSWRRSVAALEDVNLGSVADRRASNISGGQLRRVGLASALIHDAEVILLDEPTAGLDPRQRETFREVISRVSERCHVVVSTHQTEDLTDLYHSVIVIDNGKVRFSGATARFVETAGSIEDSYARFVSEEA